MSNVVRIPIHVRREWIGACRLSFEEVAEEMLSDWKRFCPSARFGPKPVTTISDDNFRSFMIHIDEQEFLKWLEAQVE